MEDAKIVDLYFARSEQAIQETGKKYGTHLSKLAYNILRSLSDTEEIVNDTYFNAWNSMPPTRPSALKHFLSRITRNLSLNRLDYLLAKKRTAEVEALDDELDDCLLDYRGSTEEAWEAREIGDSLNRFLAGIDKTDCAVFLSRYFYGETIREISREYRLPEHKVKYMLTNTRTSLKLWLEKDGVVV